MLVIKNLKINLRTNSIYNTTKMNKILNKVKQEISGSYTIIIKHSYKKFKSYKKEKEISCLLVDNLILLK
jgi:hypothetical protein